MSTLFDASKYKSTVTARQAKMHLSTRMGRQTRMAKGAIKQQIAAIDLRIEFLMGLHNKASEEALRKMWINSVISADEFFILTKNWPFQIGPDPAPTSSWD